VPESARPSLTSAADAGASIMRCRMARASGVMSGGLAHKPIDCQKGFGASSVHVEGGNDQGADSGSAVPVDHPYAR